MARTAYLPPELYRPIIEELAPNLNSLLPLLCVSRWFSYEAERLIYQSIHCPAPSKEDETHNQALLLFKQLAQCSRAAELVKSLVISRTPTPYAVKSFWLPLHKALRSLPNLEYLDIAGALSVDLDDGGEGSDANETKPDAGETYLLAGCPFQLKTLKFDWIWSFHAPLLEAQQSLEELVVRTSRGAKGMVALTPGALPRLSYLACASRSVPRVLSGHGGVTRVEWMEGIPEPGWPKASFAGVTALNVHLWTKDTALLKSIVDQFPALVNLKCTLHADNSRRSDMVIDPCGALLFTIAECPFLRKVYIQYGQPVEEMFKVDFTLVFDAVQCLEVVSLQINDSSCCEWVRGSNAPSLTTARPEDWKV